MTAPPLSTLFMGTGFGLVVIGLAGVLIHRNILRMIVGFALIDTGVAIVIVATGYVKGGVAPIIDVDAAALDAPFVDPVPAALTVTAIVIGLAVNAMMLAFAVRLHRATGSLDVAAFRRSRG